MTERSFEELKHLARPSIENPELVARVAVAALGSPVRANTVVLPSIEDEELTKAWRWLLILARDSESKYGISFDEVLSSLFRFNQEQPRQEDEEMAIDTVSKIQQFNDLLERMSRSVYSNYREQAQRVKETGFDPGKIEDILGMPIRLQHVHIDEARYCLEWVYAPDGKIQVSLNFEPFCPSAGRPFRVMLSVSSAMAQPFMKLHRMGSLKSMTYEDKKIFLHLENEISIIVTENSILARGESRENNGEWSSTSIDLNNLKSAE